MTFCSVDCNVEETHSKPLKKTNMKKLIGILLIIGLALNAYAQKNDPIYKVKSNVGLMLCGQAFISAEKPSELFKDGTNLFLIGSINYRKTTLFPYWKLFEDNAIGSFFQQELSEKRKISGYFYLDFNINVSGFDYGIGISKEVNEYISIFAECNKFFECEQFFTVGICITGTWRDLTK